MKRYRILALLMAVLLILGLAGCQEPEPMNDTPPDIFKPDEYMADYRPQTLPLTDEDYGVPSVPDAAFDYGDVPAYAGDAYAEVNGSTPYFTGDDLVYESFETYSELDGLERCGVAYACLGQDLMPTEKRGEIGMVKPSGWHTVRYDDLISDKYLYNRCHLIGFQLAGENANERNLITGTRYLNVTGMLPFENQVADYIQVTGNHVLYRVTPVFVEDELVARGVLMEGYSVEDLGQGICFCVFCYNVQPGVLIDYETGDSTEDPNGLPEPKGTDAMGVTYVLNTGSKKFHDPGCEAVGSISEKNRLDSPLGREELVASGYIPCGICNP